MLQPMAQVGLSRLVITTVLYHRILASFISAEMASLGAVVCRRLV
jgi:hypothetical protein